MFYDYAITIPADTAEESPTTQKLAIARGVIHRVEVEQYRGCMRMVGCRIYYHNHQIYPFNGDGEFKTDGYTIAFDDYMEINTEPFELEFRGYSPGTTYDHVIVIRIGVMESRVVIQAVKVINALYKFFKALGIKV